MGIDTVNPNRLYITPPNEPDLQVEPKLIEMAEDGQSSEAGDNSCPMEIDLPDAFATNPMTTQLPQPVSSH